MHENAPVLHLHRGWLGQVRRAPDGDRRGAFYRNDTTSFYVVPDEGARCGRCQRVPGVPSAPCDGACPEPRWYPAEQIARAR